LVFFAWGGVNFTFILVASIVGNFFFGIGISRERQKLWLVIGLAFNVLILVIFKYTDFIVENINQLLLHTTYKSFEKPGIILPVGISFYTFHSVSYLVDIYRGKCSAQKNIFHLALYIAMFSQLIAGPIIRYSDVWKQLTMREHRLNDFVYGIKRFIIGLSKKVLLANTLALVADNSFNSPTQGLSSSNAWLGIICYTFQIYYDFSGYSDMAIGLGHMFGFSFKENFNLPYSALSIQDFWRRWHISLSGFFRDYVYIPLGGNQSGPVRTYMNLISVFFLTGIWHGASWTFVVWGFFHGVFLIIERLGLGKILQKTWAPLANSYTWLVVMVGWVFFRSNTLNEALDYLRCMFDINPHGNTSGVSFAVITPELLLVLLCAGVFAFPLPHFHFTAKPKFERVYRLLKTGFGYILPVLYLSLLVLCTLYLISGSYNPFIYYRF
jgi:alginate O-acetyltransferase complex protein AlgI